MRSLTTDRMVLLLQIECVLLLQRKRVLLLRNVFSSHLGNVIALGGLPQQKFCIQTHVRPEKERFRSRRPRLLCREADV